MNKKRYKLLFLNHTAKLGGAEHSLIDFIRFLKEKKINEFKLYLIVNEEGDLIDYLSNFIEIYIVPYKGKLNREENIFFNIKQILSMNFVKFLRNFKSKIEYINPHIVYINSLRSLFYWKLIEPFLNKKPKTVYLVRDILNSDFINPINLFFIKNFLLRNINLYICNSFYTASSLKELIGNDKNIEVIYNPAPNIANLKSQTLKEALKTKIPSIEGKILIGSFSRISPWKNQEIILEALPYISKEVLKEIHILIFGDALFGEDDYKQRLIKRIKELSKKYPISYLGNVRDVLSYMEICDVILHTSKKPEPFGRIIIEGMNLGKIIISSGLGGSGEIIKDGLNGFIFSPFSPQDLAKKIMKVVKLIKDRNDSKIRKEAISTAKKFDRNLLYEKKIKILKQVLE